MSNSDCVLFDLAQVVVDLKVSKIEKMYEMNLCFQSWVPKLSWVKFG